VGIFFSYRENWQLGWKFWEANFTGGTFYGVNSPELTYEICFIFLTFSLACGLTFSWCLIGIFSFYMSRFSGGSVRGKFLKALELSGRFLRSVNFPREKFSMGKFSVGEIFHRWGDSREKFFTQGDSARIWNWSQSKQKTSLFSNESILWSIFQVESSTRTFLGGNS